MEDFKTQFCRLCLTSVTDINYREINSGTRQILNNVLLKLNFDDAHKQVICKSCSEKLDAAFKFKSTCLHTTEVITPYIDLENLIPVDLKEIYLKVTGIGLLVDQEICRLCMQPIIEEFISIFQMDAGIIQKYIPEINFHATMNPVICKSCVDALVVHSSFIRDCLEVEEKIKCFFTSKSSDSLVELSHLTSVKKEEIKEEIDNEMVFKSEIDFDTVEETDNEVESVKIEEMEIKLENVEVGSVHSSHDLKEIPETSELTSFYSTVFECKDVDDMTNQKTLTLETFKCDFCNHRAKSSHKFKKHIQNHNNPNRPFSCDVCDYVSKTRANLKRHMLVHIDASEIQYECEVCHNKFKYKDTLNKHMIIHRDESEVQWYKCEVCDYKTKHKRNLNGHMLVHKDSSAVRSYECELCNYKFKDKHGLKKHKLIHKDASEIQWHACNICDYKSKWRCSLKKHMVIHRDASEIQWYECDMCDYKCKYKYSLNTHIVIHKDVSEIQWYECGKCDYKSKAKGNLTKHMLNHKELSEIRWFECDVCGYKAKLKHHLSKHMLVHKDTSETRCDEKSKDGKNLKKYNRIHGVTSEVE